MFDKASRSWGAALGGNGRSRACMTSVLKHIWLQGSPNPVPDPLAIRFDTQFGSVDAAESVRK